MKARAAVNAGATTIELTGDATEHHHERRSPDTK
jgi:hypothetical protein